MKSVEITLEHLFKAICPRITKEEVVKSIKNIEITKFESLCDKDEGKAADYVKTCVDKSYETRLNQELKWEKIQKITNKILQSETKYLHFVEGEYLFPTDVELKTLKDMGYTTVSYKYPHHHFDTNGKLLETIKKKAVKIALVLEFEED